MGIAEKKMHKQGLCGSYPYCHNTCAGPAQLYHFPLIQLRYQVCHEGLQTCSITQCPNANVLEDHACISSNTASEQVQEAQASCQHRQCSLQNSTK
ncbi:hypothetical protein PVL29_027157 [Vitis rotundifolia]|uniref:Uncharacterized protein n=1 Tax=Vitis rotundifolia TaxID=103349 RepID=A0AA39D4Q3_VITRO|nr:hypothetical protein PVL29_027157 [Vitis rotundifolia]